MDSSSTVAKILTIGCLVFSLVGIVLNIIVLAVVRQIRSMQTVTNYLLANVALADLLTLIWPSNMSSLLGPNIDNATCNFLCKFIDNFPLVTMSVSALTLATLAVERYQGLVKPLSSRFKLTKTSVLCVIFIVWIVALAFLTPFLFFTEFNKEREQCLHSFTSTGGAVVVVIFTIVTALIPCVTITFCYFRIIKGLYFSNEILDARASQRRRREEGCPDEEKTCHNTCYCHDSLHCLSCSVRHIINDGYNWHYSKRDFMADTLCRVLQLDVKPHPLCFSKRQLQGWDKENLQVPNKK